MFGINLNFFVKNVPFVKFQINFDPLLFETNFFLLNSTKLFAVNQNYITLV